MQQYELENEIVRQTRANVALPPVMFNFEDSAKVASLYWKISPFGEHTQYGYVEMPACQNRPNLLKPVMITLYGAFLPRDLGNDEKESHYETARSRAEEYQRRYAQFGIFAPAGEEPTDIEKAAALIKLEEWYRQLVNVADNMYRRNQPGQIPTTALIAAEYFGLEKPWSIRETDLGVCPACSRSVRKDAIKCSNQGCGAILDWRKAYDFGLVTKDQAEEHGIKFGPKRIVKPEPEATL